MLSPIDLNRGSSKRSRTTILPSGFARISSRRHVMCRLPFLVIWTFIVMFFLYKSLINFSDYGYRSTKANPGEAQTKSMFSRRDTGSKSYTANTVAPGRVASLDIQSTSAMKLNLMTSSSNRLTTIANRPVISTKMIETDLIRKSKVFILIVQSADFRSTVSSKQHKRSPLSARDRYNARHNVNPAGHKLQIPSHISLLIDILESHKIDYAIDSTRLGLPRLLLTDSDLSIGTNQFSVIVIDDFLKYTKLSRWMRDQLDRHCRKNQIGVITYLDTSGSNNYKIRKRSPTGKQSSSIKNESLADQFPLSFKSFDRYPCRSSSTPCFGNYQLNDQSSILRILKRKQDFVLKDRLMDDKNSMPWVSMYSDHVTYEPITWVSFTHMVPESSTYRLNPTSRRDTRENNHGVLQEMSKHSMDNASMTHDQTDYRDELPDQIEKIGGSYDTENITKGYSRNQLQPMDLDILISTRDEKNNNRHTSVSSMHDGASSNHTSSDNDNNSRENFMEFGPEVQILSMFDRGLYDGIKRVIFGGPNHHWLDRILLLDAIEHLSSGRILTPLERYIQIDIDDIFVGESGKRMNCNDVDALVISQEKFSHLIDGSFKFNLGFSGKYYKHGSELENKGDECLISEANRFTWFCHTWGHSKAHLANETSTIETELLKNLQFAKEHQIPIIGHKSLIGNSTTVYPLPETYAVAPHHSGVYPIHEQLYEAWRKILNVQVTSTEEYPSLRPASGRQAFVHQTIKVLPRQTCGLYTHTIHRDKYPGGIEKLETSIRGGELFETILHNPVNIYMTHMSNYAHDRLALSTFDALIEFVRTYTNLQLKFAGSEDGHLGPKTLADYYFNLFPNEKEPIWTNPCKDKRHLAIWAPSKHKYCSIVPKLLIVGPQKTGTTALYSFLKLHPEFRTSLLSPTDFEEVQFFNDKHYHKGIDWYLTRFPLDGGPVPSNKSLEELYYFEKSATYFDDPKAPRRAKSLLPEARIVILLIDPADRAYSWYQHIKAHGDVIANSMSFEQVIMFKEDERKDESNERKSMIEGLRNRCLHPGYYSVHLSRWLEHYQSRQIIIIDGQWFRQNPVSVMNKLQLIVRVDQQLDYSKLLVYSERKGFYCHHDDHNPAQESSVICLGQSKGRKYKTMSREARLYLNRHYWPYNKQLARLLSDIGQPLPTWLDEAINSGHISSMVFS